MSVKKIKSEYKLVDIESVSEHPENPRMGNEEEIGKSISTNKFYGACIVQKSTGFIIVGNHRYRQLKAQKAKQVPVLFADVDDQTAMKILLADNKTRDNARGQVWEDKLLSTLEIVNTQGGLLGTGYIEATLQRMREEAEVPPPPPDDEQLIFSKPTTVGVVFGPISMKISQESYENWINRKLRENGFSKSLVAKALRQDLQLRQKKNEETGLQSGTG